MFNLSSKTVLFVALLLIAVCSYVPAALVLEIVPAANVPAANKRGNSSVFQLAVNNSAAAAGTPFCDDGSGNSTTSGCIGGGGVGTPGSTLFSSTTSTGPSNSAAETSLIGSVTGSTTIAANTFTPGALLHVGAQGFFSLPAVADSLTLKVKCGSTVLGSASFTPAAGVLTNGTFRVWLDIAARGTGAGGSFITNGLAELSGSLLAATDAKILNASAVAYDFTTTCVMDVTAQWGGAQVGESITGTNAAAWIPGAPVTSAFSQTGAVNIPVTTTDISTPSNPAAGKTTWYTKAGTLCSLDPSGNEKCTGGAGTASFAPPYLVLGSTKYVSATGFLATLPSSSPTWINSVTPTSVTAGANGDLVLTSNGTAANGWQIGGATTSVECEFGFSANGLVGSNHFPGAGVYIYDSTNSRIWWFHPFIFTGSSGDLMGIDLAIETWTYNGSGNPSFSGSTNKHWPNFGGGPIHLKLSVASTTLTAAVSLNGGANFVTWDTETVGTIGGGGYTIHGDTATTAVMDIYSLVIQ